MNERATIIIRLQTMEIDLDKLDCYQVYRHNERQRRNREEYMMASINGIRYSLRSDTLMNKGRFDCTAPNPVYVTLNSSTVHTIFGLHNWLMLNYVWKLWILLMSRNREISLRAVTAYTFAA